MQLYNLVFFCSILAQDFSCAMSGKFVQRCCGIYSKIAERWCYSEEIALGFFLCTVFWSLLGNIKQGFCLCNVVPRVIRHYWTGVFMYNIVFYVQHCTRFLPVQCCPKSIKATLNKFFPVQCCLELYGQHGTRFFQLLCAMLS